MLKGRLVLAGLVSIILLAFFYLSLRSVISPSQSVVSRTPPTVPVTNSWYSSLFFAPLSQPLYALPNSFQLTTKGLEVSFPRLTVVDKTISFSHSPDFTLESSSSVTSKIVTGAGDWDVSFTAKNSSQSLFTATIVKGTPAVLISLIKLPMTVQGDLQQTKSLSGNSIWAQFNNRQYLFSGGVVLKDGQIRLLAGETAVIVSLPDSNNLLDGGLTKIRQCLSFPEATNFSVSPGIGYSTYTASFFTANQSPILTTLLPHVYNSPGFNKQVYPLLGTYLTDRGLLYLTCTSKISFQLPTPDLPPDLSGLINPRQATAPATLSQFNRDYQSLLAISVPDGVYFRGKYLKNLSDMAEIAGYTSRTDKQKLLQTKLHQLLLDSLDNFQVASATGQAFYKNPEFGNELGNDHHFQYGYYLSSFSRNFSLFTPLERSRVAILLNALATEGLPQVFGRSYTKGSRFMDDFEAHSWADGRAMFADGNNQESSSEALYYWFSLWLWGTVSKNAALANAARADFYLELAGRNSYWFLLNNTDLEKRFPWPIVSLVWGGKSDYQTWFSPKEGDALGIQLQPFSPASFISEKFSDSAALTPLSNYFDKYFSTSGNQSDFYYYYLLFKEVNQLPVDWQSARTNFKNLNGDFYPWSLPLLFLTHS